MRCVSRMRLPVALCAGLAVSSLVQFGGRAAVGQQPRPGDFAAAVAGQVPPAPDGEADSLSVPAPVSELGCCDPYAMQPSCCPDPCCGPSWLDGCYGFVRVGLASLDVPVESEDAFNWTVGAVVPIHGSRLATLVALDAMHDASTQSLSTAGLVWQADIWSCSALDRIRVAALVQNYDDSLFRGANLWRSKIDVSYALTPGLWIGAYSFDHIGESDVDFSNNPLFTDIFTTRMSDIRGAYITRAIGALSLSFRAGYGNRPDSWRLGGSANVAVSDSVSAYFSADAHKEDQWSAVAGLQFDLLPVRSCRRPQECRDTIRGGAIVYKFSVMKQPRTQAGPAADYLPERDTPLGDWYAIASGVPEAAINSFTRSPGDD